MLAISDIELGNINLPAETSIGDASINIFFDYLIGRLDKDDASGILVRNNRCVSLYGQTDTGGSTNYVWLSSAIPAPADTCTNLEWMYHTARMNTKAGGLSDIKFELLYSFFKDNN